MRPVIYCTRLKCLARPMSKKKSADEVLQLEPAMEQLEQIVRRLEQGGGALDDDLADYARAIELIKQCHQRLTEAERSVQLLSGVDADGNPISQPFESLPEDLELKQAERSRRRTAN